MHGFELPVKTVRAARQKKSMIFKSCFFCPREEARRFPDCIPAYGYRCLYLLLFYGKLGQVAVKDAAESGVAAALQGVQVFVRLVAFRAVSICATAMLEQWSLTRSQLVSRSARTKPISMVQWPFCRRVM